MTKCLSKIIYKIIQEEFGISKEELISPSRKRELVNIRQYICAWFPEDKSTPYIASEIIGRDRATYYTAKKAFKDVYLTNKIYRLCYDHFKKTLDLKLNSL